MMQGDAYYKGFRALNNAGNPVTPEDVRDVEITVGHITKTYRNAELIYENGWWLFPFSQEETFGYWPDKEVKSYMRIVWPNGIVEGHPIYGVRFLESGSKEVL